MTEQLSNNPEFQHVRLDVSLIPSAAEVLRTAKVLEGYSITEIIRRAIGTYYASLQAESSDKYVIASSDIEARRIEIPKVLPDEDKSANQRLSIYINTECNTALEKVELFTGLDRDTIVNIAILYYGEVAGAIFSEYEITRASTDD